MASAGNFIHQHKPDGFTGDAHRNVTANGRVVLQEGTAAGRELLAFFRHEVAPLRAQFPTGQWYILHRPPRFAIRSDRRIILVETGEISAIEAQGNYVILRQRNTSFMVRESLSRVAEQLAPYGFLRIHRSSVVNGAAVVEIRGLSTGEYMLRLREGRQYLVSRSYKKNLRLLADLWFGLSMIQ